MATAAEPKLMTAEEFMAADLGDGIFELVRGKIIELPLPSPELGRICVNSGFVLETYGRQSGRGYALSNDSPVLTERGPDTVRGAAICCFSEARRPRSQVGRSLPPVAPDVSVEVYSPGNRRGEMSRKIAEYLTAGALMVWVVYPSNRSIAIFRNNDEPPLVLHEGDVIENLAELPGFRCDVADLFR